MAKQKKEKQVKSGEYTTVDPASTKIWDGEVEFVLPEPVEE